MPDIERDLFVELCMQKDPQKPKRVLLVDDSETQLALMQSILRNAGYELLVAHNGEEAVEQATKHDPALILMDVEMPGLSGFDTCRRLRAVLPRRTPVLFVTTRNEPAYVRAGFEAGADGYLAKPLRAIELLTKLRNYLGPP